MLYRVSTVRRDFNRQFPGMLTVSPFDCGEITASSINTFDLVVRGMRPNERLSSIASFFLYCRRSASEKSKDEAKATAAKPSSRKRTRQGEDKDHKALGGKGQGWGAKLQHVNLFSDAEREATKLLGQNADHQREKKEQELQTQKRSGLAPTALGEGSAELKDKDAQPWYTQLQASSRVTEAVARTVRLGREVTGQEAEEAIKRDQGRKGRADPLGSLFRSGAQTAVTMREMNQSKASSLELPGGARVGLDEDAIRVDEKKPSAEGKNAKKDKRHKKGKKRKKKSCKKRRKGSEQDSNGCESPGGEEDSRDVQRQQSLVRIIFFLREELPLLLLYVGGASCVRGV